MNQHPLEVSEVFKSCDPSYIASLSADKRRVFNAVTSCRTSKLGAHVRYCTGCSYREQSYNSCRNRHCPKCQGSISANWTDARNNELLPVEYFHSVFTLPQEFRNICYQNKKVFYEIMFRAVSETLQQVADRFLGAELGFITILHTWNQKLEYHPHIHVISPKGGFSSDNKSWISPRGNFFLPVRALSKVYRGKLIDYLRQAYLSNSLKFYRDEYKLYQRTEFEKLVARARKSDWVVYSKKSFGGATQVIKYLSSYVHRIAISNKRLQKIENQQVSFRYRDSKNLNKKRVLNLPANTFTQRFLLHVLPKNFTRIRHYGFLGTAKKTKALAQAREMLVSKEGLKSKSKKENPIKPFHQNCPNCQNSKLRTVLIRMIPHRQRYNLPKNIQFNANSPPQPQPALAA